MALVKTYHIGNTIIRVHDDCCVTDPAEVQRILERLGRLAAKASRREAITTPGATREAVTVTTHVDSPRNRPDRQSVKQPKVS